MFAGGARGAAVAVLAAGALAATGIPAALPAAAAEPIPYLTAVAATSPRNVWAVGGHSVARWNGTAWRVVASPVPVGSQLVGVAAGSATRAWAVGATPAPRTLIAAWNGTSWRRLASPDLAGAQLSGVAASSARSAWAVGSAGWNDGVCGQCATLILHWNGRSWRRSAGPVISDSRLDGVAAVSARDAWAVGVRGTGR